MAQQEFSPDWPTWMVGSMVAVADALRLEIVAAFHEPGRDPVFSLRGDQGEAYRFVPSLGLHLTSPIPAA